MAHYVIDYVYYSRAGRRRSAGNAQTSFNHLEGNLNPDQLLPIPVFSGSETPDGTELHFAFTSVSGAAEGNGITTDPNNLQVRMGDTPVKVIVMYIPTGGGGGEGGPGVYADAFNADTGAFTISDFVEIFSGGSLDAAKTHTANEYGWIASDTAEEVRSLNRVDNVPFLHWEKVGGATTTALSYALQRNEGGFLFAFYKSPDGGPINPGEFEPERTGYIFLTPGILVGGGGIAVGPNGDPHPVDPFTGFFVRVAIRISYAFNKSRRLPQKMTAGIADGLSAVAGKLRGMGQKAKGQ